MATRSTTTPDPAPATTGLPADEYKREQEKGVTSPTTAPAEPTKAEVITIEPGDPYPSGSPNPAPVERVAHNAEKPEWYEPVPPVSE